MIYNKGTKMPYKPLRQNLSHTTEKRLRKDETGNKVGYNSMKYKRQVEEQHWCFSWYYFLHFRSPKASALYLLLSMISYSKLAGAIKHVKTYMYTLELWL